MIISTACYILSSEIILISDTVNAMVTRADNRAYTVAEAQVITGLTKRQLNNLIDDLTTLGVVHSGNRKRTIDHKGLFTLPLSQEMAELKIAPELREQIIRAALEYPNETSVHAPDTNLYFYIKPIREKIEKGLKTLRKAERLIVSKPDIMNGEPCIRGTRIPVYDVAAVARKHSERHVQETYPELETEQIEAACIYATANPRQGRPKTIQIPGQPTKTIEKTIKRTKA